MAIGQVIDAFRREYVRMAPLFTEKMKRLWAGGVAIEVGRGGITAAAEITDLARNTVRAGMRDVQDPEVLHSERGRGPGAGRKSVVVRDPTLVPDLLTLVAPATRGDPERALRWSSKSLRKLTAELRAQGHTVSERTVSKLLKQFSMPLFGAPQHENWGSMSKYSPAFSCDGRLFCGITHP